MLFYIVLYVICGMMSWLYLASQVEVSPLQNAVSVVEKKNQELRSLISQYDSRQLHGNINLLSMCLNGVIDAAVNGGVARYQEVWRLVVLPGRGLGVSWWLILRQ